MTRFLFAKLRGYAMCRLCRQPQNNLLTVFLLCAACFSSSVTMRAQTSSPCYEPPYTFEGVPEPTLSSEYCSEDFPFQIGVGTPYLTSSQLPSPLPSQNIHVVGDFIINNAPYEFNSAIMKINPNVAIPIQGNSSSLWLTNCRLFCCNSLWRGIIVEADNGSVSVTAHTIIEDAITAIQNDPKAKRVVLDIDQAVFNRNITGIYLEGLTACTAAENPRIARLLATSFTVTAPLFLNAIPLYGIRTKNVLLPLSQFQASNNNSTFTRLRYGIYAEGSQTRLFVFNHHYTGMGRIGIFFTGGNLLLVRGSDFTNCRYSISMFNAEDLICLSNTFIFNQNSDLDRALTRVRQPLPNNLHEVQSCTFTMTGTNQTGYFTAFDAWTNPAVPTVINVRTNTFNLLNNSDDGASPVLKPSTGVKITGELIPGSDVDIEENIFNVNPNTAAHNIGVESSGGTTRNLMRIILNNFNCSGTGIRFDGSVIGTGNQVVENLFSTVASNPGTGAHTAPKLAEAWGQLPGIVTANAHEWNKKRVYEIYIGSQLFQSGTFTETQVTDLKNIGQQCMEVGGKAVLMARGLLSECDYAAIRETVEACYPPVEERSQQKSFEKIRTEVLVAPNPASSYLRVFSPADGNLEIFSSDSKLQSRRDIPAGETRFSTSLSPGFYLFHFHLSDGTTSIRKVVIH